MSSSIVYAAVFRGDVPLVEHSTESGSWDKIYVNMLSHKNLQSGFNGRNVNNMTFGILIERDSLAFLLVMMGSEENLLNKNLEDFRSDFLRRNLPWRTCNKNELQPIYGTRIKELMEIYERSLKVSKITSNLQDSVATMNESLENAVLRGKRLENIEDLADTLGSSTSLYQENSRRLKTKNCFRKYQWYIVGCVIVVLMLLILLFSICGGFDLKPRCIKSE